MKLYQKILFQIFACLLALSLSAYFVCNWIWADFGFPLLFWIAPAFFMLNGIVLAFFAKRYENEPLPAHFFLVVKMPKLFCVLIFTVIAFFMFEKTALLSFYVFFILLYLFYLLYESLILIKLNKNKS